MLRVVLLAALVYGFCPPVASGQDDDLRDPDLNRESTSQSQRDVSAAAARTVAGKMDFVGALRRFAEALPGTYGDEGPRIRAAVADMAAALKRWDGAISSYRAALNGVGDGADAHVGLGSAYFDRGRTADAIDQFRRAATLAPTWGEAALLLGLACEAQGKREESARALERAARIAPGTPAIGYARVQQAIGAGDEGEISRLLLEFANRHDRPQPGAGGPATPFVRLGLLRETAGVAPVFAPARYSEGFRLLSARRYGEAVVALQRAVDRDPLTDVSGDLESRIRAASELRQGQLPHAIERLEGIVAQSAGGSEPRRLLAAAYASNERYQESIEQLRAAVDRRPDDERSRLALVDVLLADGQTDIAERALQETTEEMPDSAQSYYRLGRLHQKGGRRPEALAALSESGDRALLVGRDFLYETIAALHVSEGRFPDAVAAYRRQLEANPNNAAAHRRLGDLYAQDGRLGESLAEFAAALLVDSRDADAYASRAQTLLRLSRFEEAAASARAAVVLNPSHEAARYALGTALIRSGHTAEGLEALQEFERLHTATRARTEAAWHVTLLKEQAIERAGKQDYRAAAEALRRALAFAPDDASIRLAAGALLTKAGAYEEAIPLLTEALAGQALEAHRYLADAYAAVGQEEQSRAHRSAYAALKAARPLQSAER